MPRFAFHYYSLANKAVALFKNFDSKKLNKCIKGKENVYGKDHGQLNLIKDMGKVMNSIPYSVAYDGCVTCLGAACLYFGGESSVEKVHTQRLSTEMLLKSLPSSQFISDLTQRYLTILQNLVKNGRTVAVSIYSGEIFREESKGAEFLYEHAFMLHNNGDWILIDAYSGLRGHKSRKIDICSFLNDLVLFLSLKSAWSDLHSQQYQRLFDVEIRPGTKNFSPLMICVECETPLHDWKTVMPATSPLDEDRAIVSNFIKWISKDTEIDNKSPVIDVDIAMELVDDWNAYSLLIPLRDAYDTQGGITNEGKLRSTLKPWIIKEMYIEILVLVILI